jgi:hypothetical protein
MLLGLAVKLSLYPPNTFEHVVATVDAIFETSLADDALDRVQPPPKPGRDLTASIHGMLPNLPFHYFRRN